MISAGYKITWDKGAEGEGEEGEEEGEVRRYMDGMQYLKLFWKTSALDCFRIFVERSGV